jgi:polyisoprenoid-binding protein YceI
MILSGDLSAREWRTVHDASRIAFEVTQMGTPIDGRFAAFEVAIDFDPEDLSNASVDVAIELDSVDTANVERDTEIRGPNWFDVANHPQATFVSTGFVEDGAGYLVTGDLTIRGVTRTIEIPASIEIDGQRAHASGEIAVERTDFDVGTGQWASGATIGTTVTIRFEIEAVARD